MTLANSNYRMIKERLFTTISVSALLALPCGVAHAQTVKQDANPPEQSAVEAIVVTAQRRSENLQNVPITIQAFSGATLKAQNVTKLDDLLKLTPNVTLSKDGPGGGTVYMRGLGSGIRSSFAGAALNAFPNVAIYLDDQSMQFPGRNVDVYMVDMERVEVLEGPQGTLFGGGAEAGVLRYITNRPRYNRFEAHADAGFGTTTGGADSYVADATVNVPLIKDRLAARVTVYNDREGGYIDNVPSTFTRSNGDLGNFYFNIRPGANGLCPDGNPAGAAGFCTPANAARVNNYTVAGKDQNPTTYSGARISLKGQIADDWSVLISQSLSNLDAEGVSAQYPVGSEGQTLKPLQVTTFNPTYNHDRWESTAWTLDGRIKDIRLVYTGSYMSRRAEQQVDYTNYSRSAFGTFYECTGGNLPWGRGSTPICYSPVISWHSRDRNKHFSQELRFNTPDDWRLRAVAGAYYENFKVFSVLDSNVKTIPSCTQSQLAAALAGGPPCVADIIASPGLTANDPSLRGDTTANTNDLQRGYKQTALFASVDFDIIPHVLTLTGGTRWYQYDVYQKGYRAVTSGAGCVNVLNGHCTGGILNLDALNEKKRYTGFRSRANLTWHVTPDVLAYATFSQGYRPGAFNRTVASGIRDAAGVAQYLTPLAYEPDSLTNYEVGLKSQLFHHRLVLNLSGYFMKWNNIQQNLVLPNFGLQTNNGINGANYDIKGVEIQLTARPVAGLLLQGSGSYNHTALANSPCLSNNNPVSAGFGNCITTARPAGSTSVVPFTNPFGIKGSPLPYSPRVQGNFFARYDWEVRGYSPWVSAGVSYTGSMYNQPLGYPVQTGPLIVTTRTRYRMSPYATIDASLGVKKDNWSLGIYGQNLNNSNASTSTETLQYIKAEVPIRPRTIWLRFSFDY